MHSKLTFAGLLLMCGGMTITSSCATDPIMPSKTELYNREFIKNFGVFDRANDWNYSNKASVTVTTPSPTDIKIYANVNGKRYLFGTFLAVNGAKELSVDVPKGITSLIVKANGEDYIVNNGSIVKLGVSKSRVITEPGLTADKKLEWTISRERMLSTSAMDQYINDYPEEEPNLGHGTTSFYFVADGEYHTFYPFYWYTSAKHILGIYYIPDDSKPDEILMQDLYCTKSGELYVSGTGACNPTISSDLVYYPGDVHMFRSNKYTCSAWSEIFPGFRTTIDKYKESSEEIQYWILSDGKNLEDLGGGNGTERIYKSMEDADFITDNGFISRIRYNNYTFVVTETVTKQYTTPKGFERLGFERAGGQRAYQNTDFVCTRGIKYRIERGIKYGFYIKVNKTNTSENFYNEDGSIKNISDQPYDYILFSQASRNKSYVDSKIKDGVDVNATIRDYTWKDKDWWDDKSHDEIDGYAYASWDNVTMGGKEYSMFGFEDWDAKTNTMGADLNDLMFIFDTGMAPSNVKIEEPEIPDTPYEWIIAVEDLGATDDFDFNDVVFGVSNPVTKADGEKYVTVRALASGGTLPVYVRYKGVDIVPEGTNEGEFHSWFEGNHPSNVVINAQGVRSTGKSYELQVDDTFTLSCLQGITDGNMGGFSVKVVKKGNSEVTEIAPPNLSEEGGEAPQMMCLPASWQWPTERIHISEAYDKFADWTKDHKVNTDWHENVTNQSLVWQRTDIAQ